MTVAGIVLAGGRSSRFGRDKLVEPIDGEPMLWRTIDAVRAVVDEVVVVAAPGAAPALPPGVRLVHDAHAFDGPLAGVAAGMSVTAADVVLVVGGDMPWSVPAVLQRLLEAVDVPGVAASILESDGDERPLPMALRRGPAVEQLTTLSAIGERRLRALARALGAAVIAEEIWRVDDPEGMTVRDVDTPADL